MLKTEYTFMNIIKRTASGRVSRKVNDDVPTFGCRRPKLRPENSVFSQTMEDLKKRLDANMKAKQEGDKMAEKIKRARHISSGRAFDKKDSEYASSKPGKAGSGENNHEKNEKKVASSESDDKTSNAIDYTKVLTKEQLEELDDFQRFEYFAQHPCQSF